MKARRFDIFHIKLEDIHLMRALREEQNRNQYCVEFTYEDSRMFSAVRKRNTQLFDALYEISRENNRKINDQEIEYTADEKIIRNFMYDAIVVEMRPGKQLTKVLCVGDGSISQKPIAELPKLLYDKGFVIRNVPTDEFTPGEEQPADLKHMDIEYVPFISSASMSRNSEYLFVAKHLAKQLMERLTLNIITMEDGKPRAGRVIADSEKKDKFLSPAKLSAYIGLSLSDGSSVAEMRKAYGKDAPGLNLNERTVICVKDMKSFTLETARVSPLVWQMHVLPDQRPMLDSTVIPSYTTHALYTLFQDMSRTKSFSKTIKKDLSENAIPEWTEIINAVTMERLQAWAQELKDPFPLCLPGFPKSADELACFAFLSLFQYDWIPTADENWQTYIINPQSLEVQKKEFIQRISGFSDAAHTGFGQYFRACKKGKVPKAEIAASAQPDCFRLCRMEIEGKSIRITTSSCDDKTILKKYTPGFQDVPMVGQGSDADLLSRFFAMLHSDFPSSANAEENDASPMAPVETFLAYFQQHKDKLVRHWVKLLNELKHVPQGLQGNLIPASNNLQNLAEFQHGYAFVYAAVMQLKCSEPLMNGIREKFFSSPANTVDITDGEDLDSWAEYQEKLMAVVTGLNPASDADKDANKAAEQLRTLWNSVRGTEDIITVEESPLLDENGGQPDQHRYHFLMESAKSHRYMARLTHVRPKELLDVIAALHTKSFSENINWDTANSQFQYWLKQIDQPEKSAERWLHEACTALNAAGLASLSRESVKEGCEGDLSGECRRALAVAYWKIKPRHFFEDSCALSDGCGFADDTIFDTLTELMTGKKPDDENGLKNRYNALIIRMPFLKGLLIRLNWQDILLEYAGTPDDEKAQAEITDVFGTKRLLRDAHVLVTESMFKGLKQLQHFNEAEGRELLAEARKRSGRSESAEDSKTLTAWEYYWQMVNEYNISLLVTGRNSPASPTTSLNYQFLATQQPDQDVLKKLTQRALRDVEGIYKPEKLQQWLVKQAKETEQGKINTAPPEEAEGNLEETVFSPTPEESISIPAGGAAASARDVSAPVNGATGGTDEALFASIGDGADMLDKDETPPDQNDDDGIAQINELYTQRLLCAKSDEFIDTKYMRSAINSRLHSLVLEMMRGKIPEIQGDVRFIVPDLDAMLRAISRQINESEQNKTIVNPLQNVGEQGMGRYYAPFPPKHQATWKKKDMSGKQAAILRNPHLAIGEDALLLPLPDEEWAKYDQKYGKLHGICMINGLSFTTVNGADSDGDRASIVTQPEVIGSIEKTAALTNRALRQMIDSKQALKGALLEKKDKYLTSSYTKKFIDFLDSMLLLVSFLPDTPPEQAGTDAITIPTGVCPPLIYAGSGSGGTQFSVEEAQKEDTLKNAFWKTFSLTTQQRIGMMSLDALDAVSAVHEALHPQPQKPAAEPDTLLRQLLVMFRMANGALQTALEIDMAKTSIKPRSAPLQFFHSDCEEALLDGVPHGECAFRKYRNAYVKCSKALVQQKDRRKFTRAVSDMTNRAIPSSASSGQHPLNALPHLVLESWKEVQTRLGNSPRAVPFKNVFREPTSTDKELQEAMKDSIIDYAQTIAARKKAADRRAQLANSYQACMHYIMQRMPLDEAAQAINSLMPTSAEQDRAAEHHLFYRWSETESFRPFLQEMDSQLRKDQVLAEFVWETDAAQRESQLETLVEKCSAKLADETLTSKISSEASIEKFTDDPSGIYLLKQYVKYLLQRMDCRLANDRGSNGIHTPAALRAELLQGDPQSQEEALYSVCIDLLKVENRLQQTNSGKLRVMSEFLAVHLLGEALADRLKTKETSDDTSSRVGEGGAQK